MFNILDKEQGDPWQRLKDSAFDPSLFSYLRQLPPENVTADECFGFRYKKNSVILQREWNHAEQICRMTVSWTDHYGYQVKDDEGGGVLYECGYDRGLELDCTKISSSMPDTNWVYYHNQKMPFAPMLPMPDPDSPEYALAKACIDEDLNLLREVCTQQGILEGASREDYRLYLHRQRAHMPYATAQQRANSVDYLHIHQQTITPPASNAKRKISRRKRR